MTKFSTTLWLTLQNTGIEGNCLNIVKVIYNKLTANFILNGKKAFPLRSGKRQGYSLSPLLLNIVLEVLSIAIREEKEIKEIQIRIEKNKTLCLQMTLFCMQKILKIESSSSWWCYLTISSYATLFSCWLQSFPASGSFPVSWSFASGGQ